MFAKYLTDQEETRTDVQKQKQNDIPQVVENADEGDSDSEVSGMLLVSLISTIV